MNNRAWNRRELSIFKEVQNLDAFSSCNGTWILLSVAIFRIF